MTAPFQFMPQPTEDLDAIWWLIAEDSRGAANRVELAFVLLSFALQRLRDGGLELRDRMKPSIRTRLVGQ